MTSPSLETFLPPADAKLTVKGLLDGFGKWWQAQPSRTGYPRYYNTDGEHYLIVWEGSPGFYDHYGDFADDNHFYNYVMKGDMIFFHVYLKQTKQIEVKTLKNYEDDYRGSYVSPEEMRTRMISEWPHIQPTLGEQGDALKAFIANNSERVIVFLKGYGDQWTRQALIKARHSLVYQADRNIYLCLWEGKADAVQPRDILNPDPDLEKLMTPRMNWSAIHTYIKQQGAPQVDWSRISLYYEVKIEFMRVPVRFEVHQRYWLSGLSGPIYHHPTHDVALRTFQELMAWPILDHLRMD